MYKYPYGDSQQLNLDWIIAKLKELEASGGSGGADLEEVSNALISLTYNNSTAYRRYDYAFQNGKLYRCLTDTTGAFDPAAWQEALIGDDLAVLTRWINAIDAAAVVDVKFDTSGTNGKIQQKYHDQYHDVVEVDYTPVQNSKRPLSSNAGYELNGAIDGKAPKSHASPGITYGKGTSTKYGHVKISDSLTDTTPAATGGIVPSMKAVSDLNGAINNFRPNQLKRKWIFIGDSYGHASGSNQGWIDKLVPMLGLSASDYYQSAVGGYSFSWTGTQFITLLQNLAASITDKNAITDIVVLGGANDVGQTAETISTAIEAFNTYAYTTFPNAIVRIGMIAGCSDPAKVAPQYSRTKEGYSNCGKAQYLHNLEFVFQNRDLVGSDNIHPTSTGYEVLTKKIFEALNGGCNVIYRNFGTPTYPSGFNAITGASTYNVIVNNEITTITIPQRTGKIAADSSSYFAVQAGVTIAVCNLPTKLFLTGAIDQHSVLAATTIATVMSKVNDNFYQIKGSLFIAGNDRTVYFLPQDTILGTTSAFNSCDRISIDAVAFTAPSIMV